jgi:hypothetical protein
VLVSGSAVNGEFMPSDESRVRGPHESVVYMLIAFPYVALTLERANK